MNRKVIKLVAMDLDGTLTQHKTMLEDENRETLDRLKRNYRLLMVGAGQCARIFRQMGQYPVDIIGNYGLQYGRYDENEKALKPVFDRILPCDRDKARERISALRSALGYESYTGDSVEFHESGCVTFPLLGTKAPLDRKLSFDPDRALRRKMYAEVVAAFPEYCVFIGGSSSFDLAPAPYDKYHALDSFCRQEGLLHENVVYIGDDYGLGGNDEAVYRSDFSFLTIDDYRAFPRVAESLLSES
jgi:HAD superfamily hydrolase (TIGR01484 family)